VQTAFGGRAAGVEQRPQGGDGRAVHHPWDVARRHEGFAALLIDATTQRRDADSHR
jgi:hypothetical protein